MSRQETEKGLDISEDLGALIIRNQETSQEKYLWDDGEKIWKIADLPEDMTQIVGSIFIRLDQLSLDGLP